MTKTKYEYITGFGSKAVGAIHSDKDRAYEVISPESKVIIFTGTKKQAEEFKKEYYFGKEYKIKKSKVWKEAIA